MVFKFLLKAFFTLLSFALYFGVVLIGISYREELQSFVYSFVEPAFNDTNTNVLTEKQLSQYNGINNKKLYVALLGSVFDVTKGERHYGKGKSYHYFAGKDGSRAFIMGDFKDESENKDHVIDLSCDELFSLFSWVDTFKNKYKSVGVVTGRYYDEEGKATKYYDQLQHRIESCKLEKDQLKQQDQLFPPCNMEWSADQGSRVWCTKTSGGVKRHWAGVPRLLYSPGDKTTRCVCVNLSIDNSGAFLKEYEDCEPESAVCKTGVS